MTEEKNRIILSTQMLPETKAELEVIAAKMKWSLSQTMSELVTEAIKAYYKGTITLP
ncbi:hypothetical protein LCGC14_2545430 [marine sediment metagenome]|uniref:Uncharacterized protein n=1 Tax=marine sediment metagenome TaxID=412755 RepID=A0A0F9APX5_9ZZZZ